MIEIDVQKELAAQEKRFPFRYPTGQISVPAGGRAAAQIQITSDAHFYFAYLTGNFTTVSGGADVLANQISMFMRDTGRSRDLFDDFIPLDLLLTPGRAATSGISTIPGGNLFYPLDWGYLFEANSTIQMEFASVAAVDANIVNLCFHGVKYRVFQ